MSCCNGLFEPSRVPFGVVKSVILGCSEEPRRMVQGVGLAYRMDHVWRRFGVFGLRIWTIVRRLRQTRWQPGPMRDPCLVAVRRLCSPLRVG